MEWAHLYTLALAVVAVLLLAFEKAHMVVIGIGLILAITLPELVTIEQAVSGFANTAIITIAALYVVGEGFLRTGAASVLANRILHRTGGQESTILFLIMTMAAVLSAFVNNTLVVVTFMPVITTICRDTGLFPSRLLIPLSYACIFGGMCTLVGTSTNLLVSGILPDYDLEPISMFELSLAGMILAGTGMLYTGLIGRHWLPRIPSLAAQPGAGEVREYVTEVTIRAGSPLIGELVTDVGDGGSRASMLIRRENVFRPKFGNLKIKEDDILVVSGRVDELASLHHDDSHETVETERYRPSTMSFFELSVTPDSNAIGSRVRDLELKKDHGAVVIGMMRNGHHLTERFADLRLRVGDVLLGFGDDASREHVSSSGDFNVVEGVAEQIYNRRKAPFAVLAILVLVTLFITGIVHSCTAALLGAVIMVVTGCLTVAQAMRSINWSVLLFIVGTIGLSKAMTETGAAAVLGNLLSEALAASGPIVLLAGVYVATVIFTELVSNNAVAVLMTPVAIAAASSAGLDPRALVMCVVFGASSSFANPMGYTTNLLVFGPGGYRFSHYLKVGLGLDVIMIVVGVTVIPMFWPI